MTDGGIFFFYIAETPPNNFERAMANMETPTSSLTLTNGVTSSLT